MNKSLIIIENADDNFSAYAPDLPGCIATGKTREEAKNRMMEAIEFHIQGLLEDGLPIPKKWEFIISGNSKPTGKFEVYMDKTGEFRFRLKAGNSHVILIGEAYKTKDRCQKGIESIIENSEDRSRYEIYRDSSGKFRFQLKAGNGEVIGQSHEYTTETSCKKGIELVKKNITAYQIIVLEA